MPSRGSFPQKERAYAIGLFNAGANVGAIGGMGMAKFTVAPLAVHLLSPKLARVDRVEG